MRNAILLSQFDVAELQLISKSKLQASQRKKITWLQLLQKTRFFKFKSCNPLPQNFSTSHPLN
jgi:hypothetical protein